MRWILIAIAVLLCGGGYNQGYGVLDNLVTSKPDIDATDYYFKATQSTLRCSFVTSPSKGGKSIALNGRGRIRLRVYDNTAGTYKYGAWSDYFETSGDIGSVSSIISLVSGRTYDAEYRVEPEDPTAFDSLGWQSIVSFDLSSGDATYDPSS